MGCMCLNFHFLRDTRSSGIAGSYGGFIPSFKGISLLSSIGAVSIYILTDNVKVLTFLHKLSSIYHL